MFKIAVPFYHCTVTILNFLRLCRSPVTTPVTGQVSGPVRVFFFNFFNSIFFEFIFKREQLTLPQKFKSFFKEKKSKTLRLLNRFFILVTPTPD